MSLFGLPIYFVCFLHDHLSFINFCVFGGCVTTTPKCAIKVDEGTMHKNDYQVRATAKIRVYNFIICSTINNDAIIKTIFSFPENRSVSMMSGDFISIALDYQVQEWLEALTLASPTAALAIGVGLTIIGSSFMAVGSVLVKIGIHEESDRLQMDVQLPVTSYSWWLGEKHVRNKM